MQLHEYRMWCCLGLACACVGCAAHGPRIDGTLPEGHPRVYVAGEVEVAPRIDGELRDAAWKGAAWTADFVDIEGSAKPRPRFRTRAKMCWDSEYLYVAAQLDEPHLWSTLTKRDSIIYHDNDFEIFIDPDGDCIAFSILVNDVDGTVRGAKRLQEAIVAAIAAQPSASAAVTSRRR